MKALSRKNRRAKLWLSAIGMASLIVALGITTALAQPGPSLEITKTVDYDTIWHEDCDLIPREATVTIRLFGAGECTTVGMPVDVMLVLDKSGSMWGAPIESAKLAALNFVDLLRNTDVDRAGLVSFGQSVNLNMGLGVMDCCGPSSGKTLLKNAINNLSAGGFTPIGDAIFTANNQFMSGRPGVDWVEVLLSDADPQTFVGSNPLDAAQEAATMGVMIYVVGLSVPAGPEKDLLQEIAAMTGGTYYDASVPSALVDIFEEIAYDIICTAGRDIVVTETVQDHFTVIDSCNGFTQTPDLCYPPFIGSLKAMWIIDQIDVGEEWFVSFKIKSDSLGADLEVDVEDDSYVTYTNYLGPQNDPIPQALVTVKDCTPDLDATKDDTLDGEKYVNGQFSPGDTILYEVVIVNYGYDATGVVYCDTVDAYTDLIPGSITTTTGTVNLGGGNASFCVDIGTIAEGDRDTITFQVAIHDPVPEWLTQVVNQGFVASVELDDVPTDDPATGIGDDDPTITPVESEAIIVATKRDSVIGGGDCVPGGIILYTVVLDNVGNKEISGLTYYDETPLHTAYVNGSVTYGCGSLGGTDPLQITNITLAPNGGCTITYRVLVDNPVPAGVDEIVNQGIVQIPGGDDVLTDDPDVDISPPDPTRTPLVASPDITVEKVDDIRSGNSVVVPDGLIDYTITICNIGDEGAIGLSFTDTIPEYTTYQPGTFQSTCDNGQQNIGNEVLQVTDFDLPGGSTCCEVTFTVRVDATVPEGVDSVSNQAYVDLPWGGWVPSDDPDTGEPDDSTDTPLEAGPFIVVEKVDEIEGGGECVVPDGIIHYTVTICNDGNQDANGMSFFDEIPENTQYIAASASTDCGSIYLDTDTLKIDSFSLAAGACCEVTFSVQVDAGVSNTVEWISNQAFVRDIPNGQGSVPSDDPHTPAESMDPTDTCLETGVNIEVNKNDFDENGSPLYPGEVLRYTVTITNNGPEDATGLTYQDPTPAYTSFINVTSQTCGTVSGTNPLNITGINLDAGQSCTIVYRVQLNSTIPEGVTEISNQGQVCNIPTDGGTTCEPSNDPGTPPDDDPTDTPLEEEPSTPFIWDPIVVKAAANLSDPGQFLEPGDIIRYDIDIENPLEFDLFDHVFEDPLPEWTGGLVVDIIPPGSNDASTGDAVIITGMYLPAGGTVQVAFLVSVDAEVPTSVNRICNQALVRDEPGENVAYSNVVCLDLLEDNFVWDPEIEAFMEALDLNGDGLRAGDVIEYTTVMTNLGPHEAHTMTFYCPLPEHTGNIEVTGIPEGAQDLSLSHMVIVSDLALEVGQTAEISFTVRVDYVLPAAASQISCQGWVGNIPFMEDELTDDPGTPALHDATVLTLDVSANKCDIDEDGTISLVDLFLQLRQIIHDVELNPDQYWAADYNGNESVDILDLMGCINVSLGAIPKAQPGGIDMFVPPEISRAGNVVSLPVLMDSPVPVGGAWFRVDYDPHVLSLDDIFTTGSSSHMSLAKRVSGSSVWVLLHSESEEVIHFGNAPVVTLRFRVTQDVQDEVFIGIDEAMVFLPPAQAMILEPSTHVVAIKTPVPERYVLEQNVPNPFNPETRIAYQLPEETHVRLDVFNLLGQRVITLVDDVRPAGSWTVQWTGIDRQGRPVPSGIYFYTIRMGRYVETKRMVLAK